MLDAIQQTLECVYALEPHHNVYDFLITDAQIAARLDASPNARHLPEKLLVRQDGETIDLSLYIDGELLDRLAQSNPIVELKADNFLDFMVAVEGVSHFLYLTWNARLDKSVSLLELELQAEVDKYILGSLLLHGQHQMHSLPDLHAMLFVNTSYDTRLTESERLRYQVASHYAGKYCQQLARQYRHVQTAPARTAELRRFYRLTRVDKISHIERRGD